MARIRTSRAGTEGFALLDALAACAIAASTLMCALAISAESARAEARAARVLEMRIGDANALAESSFAMRHENAFNR